MGHDGTDVILLYEVQEGLQGLYRGGGIGVALVEAHGTCGFDGLILVITIVFTSDTLGDGGAV